MYIFLNIFKYKNYQCIVMSCISLKVYVVQATCMWVFKRILSQQLMFMTGDWIKLWRVFHLHQFSFAIELKTTYFLTIIVKIPSLNYYDSGSRFFFLYKFKDIYSTYKYKNEKIINRFLMMIEYTLYIYTGIKRNNIISLFNIESKKKRVKVVHVLNKLNSAYSKIYTLHI